MRKRLLPFLLFDNKDTVAGNSGLAPQLTSVFGEAGSNLPVFPEISKADQERLLEYLRVCNPTPTSEGQGDEDSDWNSDDDATQWNKLRIFLSSVSSGDPDGREEEKTVGKILSVDHKCKFIMCDVFYYVPMMCFMMSTALH